MYLCIGLVTMEAFSLVEEHLFLNQIKQFIVLREGRRGGTRHANLRVLNRTQPSFFGCLCCRIILTFMIRKREKKRKKKARTAGFIRCDYLVATYCSLCQFFIVTITSLSF